MQLFLQDRSDPRAPSLHETILELCERASRGGGAFAFATRDAVRLLLRDSVFQAFASKGSFQLIVGVDDITNINALDALQQASNELRGLTVSVFYHTLPGSLFHPKFCWFMHRSKGYLIVGSGNLTARGLRGSWEAFSVTELKPEFASSLEAQWAQWLQLHRSRLRPLDDPEVRARAAQNVVQRKPAQARVVEVEAEPALAEAAEHEALVAEIPRASTRWNQANFSREIFEGFFGVRPGNVKRVVLQSVDLDGTLGALENRPGVSVKSHNFRFELEAAAGLDYPAHGRPIAVFIRIAPGTFRYLLSMPDEPHHERLASFLDKELGDRHRPNRVRRVITNTSSLLLAWPESPLWIEPLEVQD